MRERPNRTVSKTVVLKGTVGSNPTLSATPAATPQNSAGGIRTGILKGVCPLHGVTGAKRRREGACPLSGSACEAPKRDFEFPPSPPYRACSTRSRLLLNRPLGFPQNSRSFLSVSATCRPSTYRSHGRSPSSSGLSVTTVSGYSLFHTGGPHVRTI